MKEEENTKNNPPTRRLAVFDNSHEDIIGNLVTQRKFLAGGVGLVRLLVVFPLCGTQLQ